MQTQITVQDVEDVLASFVPTGMTVLDALNLVCGRFTTSGKWNGMMMGLALPNASGYITLPPRYLGILAGKYDNYPVVTLSNWFSYTEIGPMTVEDTMGWTGRIQDEEDGAVTQTIFTSSGGVRIYSNAIDNGKMVRIYGIQAETGLPVVDNQGVEGEELVLSAPFVQSLYHYDNLSGVQKDLTKSHLTANVIPMGGGAEYQVAQWQSWETRPSYRRYFIGPASKTVKALCQRRFIKMISPTDWVIPGNLAAIQCGFQALQYEAVGYRDSANEQWEDAYGWLNQESKAQRAGNQVPVPIFPFGRGGGIPFVN